MSMVLRRMRIEWVMVRQSLIKLTFFMQKNNRTKMRIRMIIVFVRMRMEWMMQIVMMIMILDDKDVGDDGMWTVEAQETMIIEASWHVAQPADAVSGDDLGGGGGGDNEDDEDDDHDD